MLLILGYAVVILLCVRWGLFGNCRHIITVINYFTLSRDERQAMFDCLTAAPIRANNSRGPFVPLGEVRGDYGRATTKGSMGRSRAYITS